MSPPTNSAANVKQVVPFFRVSDMDRSLEFYLEKLGFALKNRWLVDCKTRWCWLEIGGAALMLQTFSKEGKHASASEAKLGEGVSLVFQCEDAVELYRGFIQRGVQASEPQVGNSMWVTFMQDPDGYRLEFASATDVAEETKLSEHSR